MSSQKSVGLVLGCGASRGWAHIGVIEALEEAAIPISLIAGCSVGGYVGALYASRSLKNLKSFLLRMDGRKIFSYFDVIFPRSGILNGSKRVRELFSMHTDARTFDDLEIPVVMVATDLERGRKVVLKSGSLITALRATMSYPGLFAPVRVNGRWLVDGGLVDPVPVGIARAVGAEVIIAVDLNSRIASRSRERAISSGVDIGAVLPGLSAEPEPYGRNELMRKIAEFYEGVESSFRDKTSEFLHRDGIMPPDIIETIMTSISVMQERITRTNLAVDQPDILIQPRLGDLRMMNFDQVEHCIRQGYISVKEKLDDIYPLLANN